MRGSRPLVGLGALLTLAVIGFDVPLTIATGSTVPGGTVSRSGSLLGFAAWHVPFAAMALVGAIVASRRPGITTGWLFLGAGLLMVANGFCQDYAVFASARSWPAQHLAAWLSHWTWMPAIVLIGVILIVFPDGRARSTFWRWVARAELVLAVAIVAAAMPALRAGTAALLAPVPTSLPGGGPLDALMNLTGPVMPLGFVALAHRFVRARGIERQQMKWFVFGASLLALAALVVLALAFRTADPIDTPVGTAAMILGMGALPVTAGVAILRYRLYDIDRIINRTLVYVLLTAVLVGIYAGSVLALEAVLGSGNAVVVAGSTLVVAALFNPLRRRLQSGIDRRFYRRRYDAERTLTAFGAHLRDQVDLDELRRHMLGVLARTVQPSHAALWLRDGPTASAGRDAGGGVLRRPDR